MTVLWGLDLQEIHWNKFKSSYMWNREYHLRRTKFIVYQAAMIFSVVSESLGTAALSDYIDQQTFLVDHTPGNADATIHNNDFIGAFSYNIFSGVFVAFIFGAGFFFDLIWPERREDRGIKIAWRYSAIAAAVFELAAAFVTTIIVARHSAYVEGVDRARAAELLMQFGGPPLDYNRSNRALASVVFVWFGALFTVVSTVVMWISIRHNDQHGPKSAHVREQNSPNSLHGDSLDVEKAEPSAPAPETVTEGTRGVEPSEAR